MVYKLNSTILAAAVVAIGLGTTAHAATYTWTQTATPRNWNNSGGQNNWTSGFPNAIGDIAIVNTNIAANSTINLNQAITIGTLNIGDSSGDSRFTIAPNGGSLTFDVSAGNAAITRVATGTGADRVTAGITLNDDIDITVSSTNGSLTLSGIIGGSGKALNKLGAGTLTLSVANTYSGATTTSDGTLSISGSINNSTVVNVNGGVLSTTATNKLADTAVVTVAGGTLTVGGADTVGSLTMSSGAIGGSNTLTATTYGLSGGTVTGNLGTGTINSSGAVALNGTAGALAVNVTAGTLTLGSANRLADGATVEVSGTGILNMSTFADAVSIFNMSAGSLNGSGTLTAATYALSGGTVAADLGTGTINSSGAVALNGTAAATVVNVTAGTLTLGSADRLADGATVAVSGGTLAMDFDETVGTVAISSGAISGAGTLTASSYALTNSGTIGVNLGSGPAGLTKTGAGTAILSGNNAYSGATTVTEGTLLVNGNQSLATGAVTVAGGATLGGAGAVGGAVTVNADGTIRPGNSPGTLNVGTVAVPGSVTMAADSVYQWQFDGAAGGTVAVHGDLTLTSGWKLTLVDAGGTPAPKVKYDLFTYTGSLAGDIAAAIDYGSTGWGAASVGQEAGTVYLIFGTRPDMLSVAGSPTYDEATQTGFKAGLVEAAVTSGWGVNNRGTAVGSSIKYVDGGDKGLRAVRWDASGAAATELGTLGTDIDGYTAAVALAVNDAGTAVGRLWKNGNFRDVRAVRWDASGTATTELGNLGLSSTGVTTAEAYAVNAGGTAVGSAQMYDSGNDMGKRAVRWDASGAATELPNLGLTSSSSKAYAFAINDANTAVGSSYKPGGLSHLGTRAVRWNASGAVTELGNLGLRIDGVTDARAVAVNALGTAVGWATKCVDGNSMGDRAVRWGGSGTAATELGNLGTDSSNYAITSAFAVNDSGTAVGYAQKYVGGNLVGTRAVRWDGSGTAATELGNLGLDIDNSTEARAYAVNGAGSAVGYSQKYVGGGSYLGDRAVIWLPDAGAIDLNDLGVVPVPTGGTWTLTAARAISADGWVAGSGTFDPDGSGPLAGYVRHWVTQVGLGGTWTSPAGGTWGRGPNWSTGTPAMRVGDATFDLDSTYTVALDRDEWTKTVAIDAGTVTIDFNAYTLTAESGLTIAGGATLKGNGTIVGDIINAGTLAPGASAGTLSVGTQATPGSVTMAADSIYEWEFSGTAADKVAIQGNLNLNSGWKLVLVDAGGMPAVGSEYDLFTYTGTFSGSLAGIIDDSAVTGWPIPTINQDESVPGNKRVYLKFGTPCDADENGVVDAADYITLKKNFGKSSGATLADGDFNSSGTVNWADLSILTGNIGSGSGAPQTAPEPATLGLLMVGALAVIRRRRK